MSSAGILGVHDRCLRHHGMLELRGRAKFIICHEDGEYDQRLRVTNPPADLQCPPRSRNSQFTTPLFAGSQYDCPRVSHCHVSWNCVGPQHVRNLAAILGRQTSCSHKNRSPPDPGRGPYPRVIWYAGDMCGSCIAVQLLWV